MGEKRKLICIGCPIGCSLDVSLEDKKVIDVEGYTCKKGKIYAEKECTNPTRIVTSSVKVKDGNINMVPVKTESDIPKDKIIQCIEELKGLVVNAPIRVGDIVLKNVAETEVDIIATKDIQHV